MKNIYSLATVLLIIVLLWFFGSTNRIDQKTQSFQKANSISALESAEQFFDFGEISMSAGNVSHLFKIKNISKENVKITKIYTSCMCTTATLLIQEKKVGPFGMPGHTPIPPISEIIGPDEEANIEVVFDPAAHGPAGIGKMEREVVVENSSGSPVLLKINSFVRP